MSKLYENIMLLCERKKITGSKLCKDIGISRGLLTDLKMGRKKTVTAITAAKIANYFEVPISYLLGEDSDNEKETPTLNKKDEREISHLIEALESNDTLMFDGKPLSEEAIESIRAAMRLGLEAAKIESKRKFTPKKYRKD